jgi:hypothetical protein
MVKSKTRKLKDKIKSVVVKVKAIRVGSKANNA